MYWASVCSSLSQKRALPELHYLMLVFAVLFVLYSVREQLVVVNKNGSPVLPCMLTLGQEPHRCTKSATSIRYQWVEIFLILQSKKLKKNLLVIHAANEEGLGLFSSHKLDCAVAFSYGYFGPHQRTWCGQFVYLGFLRWLARLLFTSS